VYADFVLIYEDLNDFEQSLRSIKKSLFYAEQTTDSILLIDIHLKIGQTYNTLGDWDNALPYLQNALDMSETLRDSSEFIIIYGALARVEAGKGNKNQAVTYLKDAIHFGKLFNREEHVLGCLYALTSVYFDVAPQQLDSAAQYALEGIEMLKETSEIYYEKELMQMYSEIQAVKGNFEEALAYHKSYFRLHDSIYTQDAQAVLREEQVRQNVQEYQAQQEAASLKAELLTSQNRFYLTLLIALLFVLLIGAYLFYQIRKSKQIIESKNGELEKLNQTKDKFFGIIAHDIRSPILALENVGSQMEYYLEKGKTEKLKQLSSRIDNTAKRVTNLLDNLLNWALLQQGVLPHHPNTLSLNEIILQNIEMFQMSATLKGIQLESQLTKELKVVADESALNTILRNLISNAIKFTPKGGKVAVMANLSGEQVLLKVQDSGIGMSAEQVNNIFVLNKKSKKGTAGERGTGLGLMLCKELVDLNKGTISVESQPEKGSDFSVTLPLAA
ncbi:MAG: tetratricopeptide repeat-containing sensor histidine kinase, partial [Bacteroidota bacterium]